MPPILLTAAELELFSRLPAPLREGMGTAEETRKHYETDQELEIRAKMAGFDKNPKIAKLVRQLKADPAADPGDLSWMEGIAFSDLAFIMGARGLSLLIMGVLRTAQTADDMGMLVMLSEARGHMLDVNAETDTSTDTSA